MSARVGPPIFQSLFETYELKGRISLGALQTEPSLVHCGADMVNEGLGYDTRAVEVPWEPRVVIALVKSGSRIDPEVLARARSVYAVTKRLGGPFPDRIGVGRARTADISLRAPSVSKYHAYFTRGEGPGDWVVVDARSRNGTRLGEQRLLPATPAKIESGTQVMFGDETFLFFTPDGLRTVLESLLQSQGR